MVCHMVPAAAGMIVKLLVKKFYSLTFPPFAVCGGYQECFATIKSVFFSSLQKTQAT